MRMESKWFTLKSEAIMLRKKGLAIGAIEHQLQIPRSTLSGWFKDIKLSAKQKEKIIQNWKKKLVKSRESAILWHNQQKENRLLLAKEQALDILESINTSDKVILELALALLYLGEGTKKKVETSMGNTNPVILKFFITLMNHLYDIDIKKIKCQLTLRADQDPQKMKKFWSKELGLPISNFGYINIDKRTIGSKTYPYYKGVCYIICGNVAIQRKLLYLSEIFCSQVIKNLGN